MRTPLALCFLAFAACLFARGSDAAVGRTVGQFAVSATGSAQYTVPIFAPPGPRGMQPNIALLYDSRVGIGPLGVGWSLAGLGSITRCNQTVAQDAAAAPVALVATDGYCINGSRLRLTSTGDYGAAGSTYQTEVEDFTQATAEGTQGNGPSYWMVQGPSGMRYYYGYVDQNDNGQSSQVIAAGTSTVLTWLLSKVVDPAGNNYVVNYTTFGGALVGTAVPSAILWTPTSTSSYAYSMQFIYQANALESSIDQYVGGTHVFNNELLSSIEILYGSTVVKDYILAYQPSPSTAREELKTITECSDSTRANCLSPTSVSYVNGTAGVSTTSSTALKPGSPSSFLAARYDLNGDGIPDLVYYVSGYLWVNFGTSTGTYQSPINTGITTSAHLLGNLNAASQDGILAVNGSTWYYYTWNGASFVGVSTGLPYDSTAAQYELADVNGDGRPDLIALYSTGSGATIKYGINKNVADLRF